MLSLFLSVTEMVTRWAEEQDVSQEMQDAHSPHRKDRNSECTLVLPLVYPREHCRGQ